MNRPLASLGKLADAKSSFKDVHDILHGIVQSECCLMKGSSTIHDIFCELTAKLDGGLEQLDGFSFNNGLNENEIMPDASQPEFNQPATRQPASTRDTTATQEFSEQDDDTTVPANSTCKPATPTSTTQQGDPQKQRKNSKAKHKTHFRDGTTIVSKHHNG